jgi:hypothetical protein
MVTRSFEYLQPAMERINTLFIQVQPSVAMSSMSRSLPERPAHAPEWPLISPENPSVSTLAPVET